MELPRLTGKALEALHASEPPGQWTFRLDDGSSINVECDWRIVSNGRVMLAAKDHRQLFGRQEPVDAANEALALLAGKRVTRAAFDQTGDLVLELEGSIRVETFTNSSGYESCTIKLSGGAQYVVVGGGGIEEF